jgi:hypothetical protein
MSRGLQTYRKSELRRALIAAREAGVRVGRVILSTDNAIVEFDTGAIKAPKAEARASRRGTVRRQATA